MTTNKNTPNPVTGLGAQNTNTSTHTTPPEDYHHYAARVYAARGFNVGPLRGKVPLTRHGMKDFTTDPEQIDRWWKQYPGANVGARPPAGWVVLDIDPRNGGADTWAQLNKGRTLPDTIVTFTGSNGLHYWFRLPHDGAVRGSAGEGIDVKTMRGYLVMPPSIHPDTDRMYMLRNWVEPAEVPVLPEWLHTHVYRPVAAPKRTPARRGGPGDGSGLVGAVSGAGEGQRNAMLYWAACRALEDGLDLEDELTTAAQGIGLGDREIAATLASARVTVKGAAA